MDRGNHRRAKTAGGVISRRRKRRPESRAESVGRESSRSESTELYDFENVLADDYDFDGKTLLS